MNYYEYLWNMPGRTPDQGLVQLPRRVEFEEYIVPVETLTIEQLDSANWNRAVPIVREDFTTYETEWVKGEDFTYHEEVVSSEVDVVAKFAFDVAYIESKYGEKLKTLDGSLLITIWSDGVDLEAKLSSLRLQRNQILTEKELEILSLLT